MTLSSLQPRPERDEPPSEDAWWKDDMFTRGGPVARWLNGLLETGCRPLQAAFERHAESDAGLAAAAVRRDVVRMTRWDVLRNAGLAAAQNAYAPVRDVLGWLAAITVASLLVSRGPIWLELILALACGVFAFGAIRLGFTDPGDDTRFTWTEGALLAALLAGLLAMIVLFAHPSAGLSSVVRQGRS